MPEDGNSQQAALMITTRDGTSIVITGPSMARLGAKLLLVLDDEGRDAYVFPGQTTTSTTQRQ